MHGAIAWFAHNPVAANLIMLGIVFGGLLTIPQIRQEVFPEIEVELVTVSVAYPGAAPAEVEEAICVRIEEEIQGVDGIDRVRSTASEVFGVPPQGSAAQIALKRVAPPDGRQTPLEYLTETLRRDDLENGEEIQVGPYIGYLADVKIASGDAQARKIAVLYKDGGVYLFNGELGKVGDPQQFSDQFRATVFSFRAMTGQDLRLVNRQKLKIIEARPGDTYGALARKVPLRSNAEATLRLINGHHPRGEPRAGDRIKIIQ